MLEEWTEKSFILKLFSPMQGLLPALFMQDRWLLAEKNAPFYNTGMQMIRLSCLSVCPFVTVL